MMYNITKMPSRMLYRVSDAAPQEVHASSIDSIRDSIVRSSIKIGRTGFGPISIHHWIILPMNTGMITVTSVRGAAIAKKSPRPGNLGLLLGFLTASKGMAKKLCMYSQ